MEEGRKRAAALAEQILKYARNEMMVALRFLDLALSRLKYLPERSESMETDGAYLYYDPWFVFKLYEDEDNALNRTYLHTIFHCVFYHPFVNVDTVDRRRWDLACDIAVEGILNELELKKLEHPRQAEQNSELQKIVAASGKATAERIYRYLTKRHIPEKKLKAWEELFARDCHDAWYIDKNPEHNARNSVDAQTAGGTQKGGASQEEEGSGGQTGGSGTLAAGLVESNALSKAEWEKISARIKVDLETISNGRNGTSEYLLQNITEVNRERYDYTSFLQKFAVLGEAMQINDDEFDYNFYTYGLSLYRNVPLIEPLEYKDVKRIKEFVLAIDTSGSVQGDLVQKFVQKTYNVLKSTESFFSKINLHIIQCDDQIQEDRKITSQEEFDAYFQTMELHGFGGNNEIKLFSYVSDLIRAGEFQNLKGMIYFTDGYGIFPEQKPEYDVAFVFVENERWPIPEDIPPWVIKLVLEEESI